MAATLHEVLSLYRQRHDLHTASQRTIEHGNTRVLWAMLLVLPVIAWRARLAFTGAGPAWTVLIPLAAEAALVWFYLELQTRLTRVQRLLAHTETAIARADGTQTQSGRTGEDLRTPHHLYDRDLDILGPDSVFGLLATVRTGLGERGLAGYLLTPTAYEDARSRQSAVQELAPRLALREHIATMGTSRFQQVPANLFDDWLAAPAPVIPPAYRVALVATALLLTGLLIATLAQVAPVSTLMPYLLIVAALQMLLASRLKSRLKPILESTVRLSDHVHLVSEGLALLGKEDLASPKLQQLQATVKDSAVPALARLQSQIVLLQQRDKGFFMALSLLIAAGTQAAISIARWKLTYAAPMQQWLAAWSEFEALNALATYAFEHPENTYPELLPPTTAPTFVATSLGHPLLPRDACVLNDVTLDPASRFYLISGSNMAGKSTLLRSIGLNAVLAYAGAPVRAGSLRLTPLEIGASLALTDSLAEAKSKFKAEVERLATIVQRSQHAPVLFLIDELFSGTNSHDRRAAAEAVLRTLLANQAIGALSTHDLALTDLATPENHGSNIHMASPDPDDPLAFDYRLKPGVNRSSNALAILRMMGLEA
jgi:hypothetical protein